MRKKTRVSYKNKEKINKLFNSVNLIKVLNEYLADKQTDNLPYYSRLRRRNISSVKALVMMLLKNNMYDILSKLELPIYIKSEVKQISKKIQEKIKYVDLYNIFGINENQYDSGRKTFISYITDTNWEVEKD